MSGAEAPISVKVDLTSLDDSRGGVQVQLCAGFAGCANAEPQGAQIGELVSMHYLWTRTDGTRPFVRVSGEPVATTMLFDDLPIHTGHVFSVPLVSKATSAAVVQQLGVRSDAGYGIVVTSAFDCSARRIAGAQFELRKVGDTTRMHDVTQFYFQGRSPVLATPTSSTEGDLRAGGFAGVTPGNYVVSARYEGRELGRTSPFPVRSETISYALILPSDRKEAAEVQP